MTPPDIQKHITAPINAKASDKTVSLHLQALKSAFNFARRMQVIDTNPADPVSHTVEEEMQREEFTEEEAKKLIDAAEGEGKTLLRVGYYTGLRLMKAATLRWEAIDLRKGTMTIPKPGKRSKALIQIPLHDVLFKHLKKLKQTDDFVMPYLSSLDSGGKRGLSQRFKVIAKKANVDLREETRASGRKCCRRSFHSLRHGFVSGLANMGVSDEKRRMLTGHKTDREHQRYTHIKSEALREEINKLPGIPD